MGKYFYDKYSLLHFAVGIVFYFWGFSFMEWNVLHVMFEIFENTPQGIHFIDNYIKMWPGGKKAPDTLLNSTGDVFFGALGWIVAYVVSNTKH